MTLIAAQATSEQASHFARLAQIASEQFFQHLFGSRAGAVLESMFLLRDNDNSHRYTTFLLQDDRIAGMLHGYPATDAGRHAARSHWLYLRYAAWQLPRLLALGFLLRDLLDFLGNNLHDGDFYLAMLAIDQPYRGRGHSKTLILECERLARERGCARLTLDVDERNHIARAAYARAGFEQWAQSEKVKLAGERFALLRLVKPIAPKAAPLVPAR